MTHSETVKIPSTNGGGSARAFHTAQCRYVRNHADSMRDWDRETAEAWGFDECRRCRRNREGEGD